MISKLSFAAAAVLLAACATVPADPVARIAFEEANDPLEPLNRAVFAFNLKVDEVVLEPAARGYRAAVPAPGRDAVRNFLRNLSAPVMLANDLLQGNLDLAAQTSWGFVMNSIVGIGGLFDVASNEPHDEDVGQTLAVWGVPEGPYLMLPFGGPSTVRDAVGIVGDRALDPFGYWIALPDNARFFAARAVTGAVDARERTLEELNDLQRSSLDFYVTMRSLYRQARSDQIRNGAPAPFGEFTFE